MPQLRSEMLPPNIYCPHCSASLDLDATERKTKHFICPACNLLIDLREPVDSNGLQGKRTLSQGVVSLPNDVLEDEKSNQPTKKRLIKWMFIYWSACGLLMGIVGRYVTRSEILNSFIWGGAAWLLMEWVHRDRRSVKFNLGVALDLTVLFIAPIGLLVYFVRSRGWKRGLGRFGYAVIVFCVLLLSFAISWTIGRYAFLQLFERAI